MELYLKQQFRYLSFTEIYLKIAHTYISSMSEVNISWLVLTNIFDKRL